MMMTFTIKLSFSNVRVVYAGLTCVSVYFHICCSVKNPWDYSFCPSQALGFGQWKTQWLLFQVDRTDSATLLVIMDDF